MFDESEIEILGVTDRITNLKNEIESNTGNKLASDALAEVRVSKSGKTIGEIGRVFGKRVVFFTTKENVPYNGLIIPESPNTIYLHVKTSEPHLFVIGHELLHALKV